MAITVQADVRLLVHVRDLWHALRVSGCNLYGTEVSAASARGSMRACACSLACIQHMFEGSELLTGE